MGFFGMLDCFSPSMYRSLRPQEPVPAESTMLARLSGSTAITRVDTGFCMTEETLSQLISLVPDGPLSRILTTMVRSWEFMKLMMVSQSFLLENGRFTTINVPFPDVLFTDVSGINNRGQIVGRYVKNNPDDLVNPFSNHGFIATPQSEPESKSPAFSVKTT